MAKCKALTGSAVKRLSVYSIWRSRQIRRRVFGQRCGVINGPFKGRLSQGELEKQSLTFLKVGGLTDWSFVLNNFDRLLLVVAFSSPVMPIENRDYLKLVLLYIAQYCGDSDNRIRVSEPHRAKE